MQTRAPVLMGGGVLTDIGHGFMKMSRSGIGLFKNLRGDTGDTVVEGSAPVNYTNMAVYGTLAALAILIVAKSTGKRK
jgi:hypothetical protein